MKRLLLLAAMFLCMVNINAQYASMDKTEENGSRHIMTEAKNIYRSTNCAASIQLEYLKGSQGTERYYLCMTINEYKMQIDKGRKLLLKFDDNSIMELENDTKIGPTDYTFKVSSGVTYYFVHPDYIITKEQIEEIISKNIVKIRIENNVRNIDREIKKDKFSEAIKEMYATIQDALVVEKDVYTGF